MPSAWQVTHNTNMKSAGLTHIIDKDANWGFKIKVVDIVQIVEHTGLKNSKVGLSLL